jgi:Ca2+-binding EF-hand superfamily protein
MIFSIILFLGFTPKQLQRLYTRFLELDKRTPPVGYLTRQDLLEIREVALNPLGERLVDVIIQDHGSINLHIFSDKVSRFLIGDNNRIDFHQFATILARFRRGKATTDLNTKEKKLLFLFSVCFIKD